MTPLNGTLALAEMNDIAMRVGHDLNFDMPRVLDEPLDKHAVVAETGPGFIDGGFEPGTHFVFASRDPHSLAATAGRRLDHDRKADVARYGDSLFSVRDGRRMARNGVHPRFSRKLF